MGNLAVFIFATLFFSTGLLATEPSAESYAFTRGRVELVPPVPQELLIGCPKILAETDFSHPRRVMYQEQILSGIQGQYDPHLGTFRYFVDRENLVENPKLILPIFHGIGAKKTSHGGISMRWVRTLSMPKDRTRKEVAKALGAQNKIPFPVAAETLDWPFSGNFIGGADSDLFNSRWSRENIEQTLQGHFARLREKYALNKIVAMGASASPALLGAQGIQSVVDGLVLVGPVIPGDAPGFPESVANYFDLAEKKIFEPNLPAFNWMVYEVLQKLDWALDEQPFKVPTLILVGENDPEVPFKTRLWLENQAKQFAHVEFHVIPNARHDVLTSYRLLNSQGQSLGLYDPTYAYSLIYDFLERRFGTL